MKHKDTQDFIIHYLMIRCFRYEKNKFLNIMSDGIYPAETFLEVISGLLESYTYLYN
jgi:hypothetical protein